MKKRESERLIEMGWAVGAGGGHPAPFLAPGPRRMLNQHRGKDYRQPTDQTTDQPTDGQTDGLEQLSNVSLICHEGVDDQGDFHIVIGSSTTKSY